MRNEVIEELIREVMGPRKGVREEIDGNPLDEYITGVIIPCRWKSEGIDPEGEVPADVNDDESEASGNDSAINPVIDSFSRPASFGISFFTEDPVIRLCVTWGTYRKKEADEREFWKREPRCCTETVELDEDIKEILLYEEGSNDVRLNLIKRNLEDGFRVTVTLVNNLDPGKEGMPPVDSCIFQPSIRIRAKTGSFLTIRKNQKMAKGTGTDERSLYEFLYRNRPVKARGHNCSAVWKEIDYAEHIDRDVLWPDGAEFIPENGELSEFLEPDLRTEFVPLIPVPLPSFTVDGPEIPPAEMISDIWEAEELEKILMPLHDAYKEWIDSNYERVKNHDVVEDSVALEIIEKQRSALSRIKKGIDLIIKDENIRLAFCFANRAIALQHRWNGGNSFVWRPFQLAFMLMTLESIAALGSDERDILDLLWIPTGGGKTEAYLGIMAFTVALRRIRGSREFDDPKRSYGTAVISRYTLRLLTIQQFRRTLSMVTAAEYLRVFRCGDGLHGWRPPACSLRNDWIYGSERISIGMWVGGKVSPLHLRGKNGSLDILQNYDPEEGRKESEPAQILKCPACGSWLSIPDSGLPSAESRLYIVLRLKEDSGKDEVYRTLSGIKIIEKVTVTERDHSEGFITVTIEFSDGAVSIKDLKELKSLIEKHSEPASLSFFRPGYFGTGHEPGRRKGNPFVDYEIFCPDPECPLNRTEWMEGRPAEDDGEKAFFPDGNVLRKMNTDSFPFKDHSRIPVPAFTTDEQIYCRCPSVVVATADKFARLAYEPRAASLTGNINRFNFNYGYHRDKLFPKETTRASERKDVNINPFRPPELIIQDELHLIDGPLGSMFGLYEAALDGIIRRAGGRPKYLASTATISNAENQVKQLFARELFQFPPNGLEYDDSFFVHENPDGIWDEKRPGRIYMGVCPPGRGVITPQIRLWSSLLKKGAEMFDNENIRYYWTVAAYYNSLRELGGALAIYREDVEERLKIISGNDIRRNHDPEKIEEISSRIMSTDLPLILNRLERDGERERPEYDALFATSMFGTGIDIPHLSLMIVNGQPKTTGSYIQTTGRIGRSYGGLVVTLYNPNRPRDMSHYEMFTSYHMRLMMDVEPVSVSPFSRGAMERALGPAAVAFLRNIPSEVPWYEDDGELIVREDTGSDLECLYDIFEERLEIIYGTEKAKALAENLKEKIRQWKKIAGNERENELRFHEYLWRNAKPKNDVVLGDPQHEYEDKINVVYRNAPQSLRDVEETTGFKV